MGVMLNHSGNSAEIILSDRFAFADSSMFRKALNDGLDKGAKSININMKDLVFMDSSGLGMLMVALKECQQKNARLTLSHPQGEVKSLLEMTKSYDRFTITNG